MITLYFLKSNEIHVVDYLLKESNGLMFFVSKAGLHVTKNIRRGRRERRRVVSVAVRLICPSSKMASAAEVKTLLRPLVI